MNTTMEERINRALDHADAVTENDALTKEQRLQRRESSAGIARAIAEFYEHLTHNTLHELPKVSDRMKQWEKWANEVEDE